MCRNYIIKYVCQNCKKKTPIRPGFNDPLSNRINSAGSICKKVAEEALREVKKQNRFSKSSIVAEDEEEEEQENTTATAERVLYTRDKCRNLTIDKVVIRSYCTEDCRQKGKVEKQKLNKIHAPKRPSPLRVMTLVDDADKDSEEEMDWETDSSDKTKVAVSTPEDVKDGDLNDPKLFVSDIQLRDEMKGVTLTTTVPETTETSSMTSEDPQEARHLSYENTVATSMVGKENRGKTPANSKGKETSATTSEDSIWDSLYREMPKPPAAPKSCLLKLNVEPQQLEAPARRTIPTGGYSMYEELDDLDMDYDPRVSAGIPKSSWSTF
ncbi:uncharacterized protein BCR38DRAFT_407387 [Pseudomassariella vexata]|uniref:Uncharacterized protein n=1 Tax=Pseudomassariella vexata TaxID=1141098 RepID=A0A1Y2E7Z8_9PEZI|nr:uncharacterized protein BCR38DRAFT_407387 [Pseudomassariella vexata]ORY67406.1 hypothetical protein BCR38DRAFT_407387 [Pseudomassariella vexata]